MAGTKAGGKQAAATNRKLYGNNFYKVIGKKGGQSSSSGGFGQGLEGKKRASLYGAVGGAVSRRGPNKLSPSERKLARLRALAVKREVSTMQVDKLSRRFK